MKIICNIVTIAFPLLITMISYFLAGRKSYGMLRFYLSMMQKRTTRKVYVHFLLFVLLIFHFVYSCTHVAESGVLLSTLIIACMYRFDFSERILQLLNRGKHIFIVASVLTVVLAVIPHLFTLSLTLAYILLASIFYPTRLMIERYNAKTAKALELISLKIYYLASFIRLYSSVTKYIKSDSQNNK